jgi:hypothetical protein
MARFRLFEMVNFRLLNWPNFLTIPVILAFWIVLCVLGARLLGAAPASQQEISPK